MKRSLCAAALLAVAAIPDWASACWFGRGPVRHGPPVYAYRPVYCPPVCYPAPPPPCVPMTPVLPPPRVETVKPMGKPSTNTDRPPAKPSPAPPDPMGAKPNTGEPIRPAGGIGGFFGGEQGPRLPARPEPKMPPLELPKDDPKLPPLELPKENGTKLPPLELPRDDPKPPAVEPHAPKLPSLELPGSSGPAVPAPAPAPDATTPAPKNADALPPLTLPPDTPVVEPPTVAKSSPLTGGAREPKVSVFPAAGTTAAAGGLRKVGFFNHTDRDLALVIDGKAVTLPAKSYIHAQVPPTFTWKHGKQPAATETIPADAAGLDVLFRD